MVDINRLKNDAKQHLSTFTEREVMAVEIDDLASKIDHTALKPQTSEKDVNQLCLEAKQHSFAAVCVPPSFVATAASLLEDSDVNICTVVGFPLGYNLTSSKCEELSQLAELGAKELDFVAPIHLIKQQKWSQVRAEFEILRNASSCTIKVIIETCYLSDFEKVMTCLLAVDSRLDYVKTSTGFGTGGASIKDVLLMAHCVDKNVKIKASGGIRTKKFALQLIASGASRIGASQSIDIVKS